MKQNPDKIQRRIQKHERKEQLTNMYMIQMTYGIVGVILLRYIQAGYSWADRGTAPWDKIMPFLMNSALLLFAAGAGVLALLLALGKMKNVSRTKNYVVFLSALALVTMWIKYYNAFRIQLWNLILKVFPKVYQNADFGRFYILMYCVGVYLVIGFIVYSVKLYRAK